MDKVLPENEDFIVQKLQERLKHEECPFNWMLNCKLAAPTQSDVKLVMTETEARNQNFVTYLKYMRTTYDLGIRNDDNVCLDIMAEWEKFLTNGDKKDPFFIKLNPVLNYIFYSSGAHIFFKIKKYKEVEYCLGLLEYCLVQTNLDTDILLGCISGVKAKFFETFGKSGYKEVFVHVMLAVQFDPEEAEWLHLTTSTLRNIRLQNIESPESKRTEEFRLFQILIDLQRNPSCLIHFGNYRLDVVNELISEHKDDYGDLIGFAYHNCGYNCYKCKEIHNYIRQGLECFKKALTVEEPEIETYLKVIRGVINIPSFYRKSFVKFTSIWIKKVEENIYNQVNNRNGEAFYLVWKYYQNLGMNNSRYTLYLRRSAVLGFPLAKKELIPIMYRENVGCYNPQGDILEVMNLIPEKSNKLECLTQLISYHVVVKKNLLKALPFITQLREEDPGYCFSHYFQEHRSWFLMKDNRVDLTIELERILEKYI